MRPSPSLFHPSIPMATSTPYLSACSASWTNQFTSPFSIWDDSTWRTEGLECSLGKKNITTGSPSHVARMFMRPQITSRGQARWEHNKTILPDYKYPCSGDTKTANSFPHGWKQLPTKLDSIALVLLIRSLTPMQGTELAGQPKTPLLLLH